MSKPIALDICCRKGGATVGLQRAGFYVIGYDIEPQPGYPGDELVQADGLVLLRELANGDHLNGYIWSDSLDRWFRPALLWQSWPCQEGNTQTQGTNKSRGWGKDHEQFIPRARELSDKIGIPYVIEQPSSSKKDLIRKDLTLCMDMFKGNLEPPWVQKHRSFELARWPAYPSTLGRFMGPGKHPRHTGYVRGWRHGVYRDGPYVAGYGKGGGKATVAELRHAMGIDWMTELFDLQEAIPPAYSEYIGRAFLSASV